MTYGRLAKDDARPLDGDTVFEIGSITKVFTSLLLAEVVQRRDVALTDPISKVVDAQVTFETDGQGKATALVLHQNGRNARAPRVE